MSEEQGGKRPLTLTVKCQYDGFGFDLTAELTSGQIPALIERLREVGVEPANSPYVWEAKPAGVDAQASDPPVCRIHGKPMKASRKGGHYCTAKLADGSYCTETL